MSSFLRNRSGKRSPRGANGSSYYFAGKNSFHCNCYNYNVVNRNNSKFASIAPVVGSCEHIVDSAPDEQSEEHLNCAQVLTSRQHSHQLCPQCHHCINHRSHQNTHHNLLPHRNHESNRMVPPDEQSQEDFYYNNSNDKTHHQHDINPSHAPYKTSSNPHKNHESNRVVPPDEQSQEDYYYNKVSHHQSTHQHDNKSSSSYYKKSSSNLIITPVVSKLPSKPKFTQGMLVTAYGSLYKIIMSGYDLSDGIWKYAVEDPNGITSKVNEAELVSLEPLSAHKCQPGKPIQSNKARPRRGKRGKRKKKSERLCNIQKKLRPCDPSDNVIDDSIFDHAFDDEFFSDTEFSLNSFQSKCVDDNINKSARQVQMVDELVVDKVVAEPTVPKENKKSLRIKIKLNKKR